MSPPAVAWFLAGAAAAAFAISLAATPLAMRVARQIGYIDRPGGHKSHREAVPYGGGVAIVLGGWLPVLGMLVLALLLPQGWAAETFGELSRAYIGGLRERAGQACVILAGGLLLHGLGLYDDVRPQGALSKLVVMLAVGWLISAVGHVRLLEEPAGPVLSVFLTTLWIVLITNAFNFLDNMDGLSAGVACICLAFLAVCGLGSGQVHVPVLASVFFGAILGFLVYNFPPARVFMGDAGSLPIGYMVAVISVLTTYYESGPGTQPYALAIPLVVLAVPLYDFATVVTIRIREGRNPLRGDQRHFSHRLVEHGLSRRFAVLTIYLATAATGLAATLLPGANLRQTVTIGLLVLMVLAIIAILERPVSREP
jgi:UDP-GlcNAc:undecaprenyl-phosphate GlcNAc-1-phosphate transferase